jgi:hypothetical protein
VPGFFLLLFVPALLITNIYKFFTTLFATIVLSQHPVEAGAAESFAWARKEKREMRKSRGISPQFAPHVTIRVSGKLFQGHLPYLDQLVRSAADCRLWPQLNLARLEELDRAALFYLIDGENRDFSIVSCPSFIREWMDHEKERAAA